MFLKKLQKPWPWKQRPSGRATAMKAGTGTSLNASVYVFMGLSCQSMTYKATSFKPATDIRLVMAELGIARLDLTHLCAKDFCFGIAGHLAACVQNALPWLPVHEHVLPLFVSSVQRIAHSAEAWEWIPRCWFLREPPLVVLTFWRVP